ncbi:MAG TPA: hypothetical protein VL091_14010 [Marinobacter sp.]|nr:hypothetical protein [Marinobacter sp.]
MSTKNKAPAPATPDKVIAYQNEGAVDAGGIAENTIQILLRVNAILTPVIGELGVNALFKRALHLTSKSFPWLTPAETQLDTSDLLEALSARLAGRNVNEAAEARSVLLADFTELLTTLIGHSLVETLLGSLSASLSPSFNQKTAPSQDTTP